MKKVFILSLTVLAVMTAMAFNGASWAGRGNGVGYAASQTSACVGPMSNAILTGTPVTITGSVQAVCYGQGITVDTGAGTAATIYGLGPIWYWDSLGVARPTVGDVVAVKAYEVTFSDGTTRLIAVSIDINGSTVTLRDMSSGLPLWAGSRWKRM
ncbi:MAG: hypothetical protein ACP5J5_06300 [Dissulfurimicrobium sp.]|uniref:hypothetical protein n=1 Tax=Dissulfurimicrobium hydrothermale TaxID=1750598 RepID=UPI001EDA2686|nr:hypothetical protein [Dissulfurimicrobium hydrothermale]UKL13341.1 hypothetical protein LGS26_07585 [Dissulfurimicrobium hydrothermale]